MKLLDDIRHHLATLNSGQQQREAAVLLREAATALDRGRWIPVSERLPEIAPEGVSATVIAAHVGYDLTMQGFISTGELRSSPADYIGSDENGPCFTSMKNGRRLDVVAWMPLPEPPACP